MITTQGWALLVTLSVYLFPSQLQILNTVYWAAFGDRVNMNSMYTSTVYFYNYYQLQQFVCPIVTLGSLPFCAGWVGDQLASAIWLQLYNIVHIASAAEMSGEKQWD